MASYKDFLFGGMSGIIATATIQPVDHIKIRIQKIGESQTCGRSKRVRCIAKEVFGRNGVWGFYVGLSPAIVRQATYGTTRLGLYKYIYHSIEQTKGKVSFMCKVGASMFAGFVASIIGNPFDVAMIRLQTNAMLPKHKKKHYKSLSHTMKKMIRKDGVCGLWRGCTPIVLRAMAINLSMLTTYDQIKEEIDKRRDSSGELSKKLIAGAVATIITSTVSLPFDNIKTKVISMTRKSNGNLMYKGFTDCVRKSVRREGARGLWVGLPVYYLVAAPHAMLILLVQDLLHANFNAK